MDEKLKSGPSLSFDTPDDSPAAVAAADVNEALVKEEAVRHAYISYILADHSKFGQISSVTFADISSCCIITDKEVGKNYHSKTIIKVVE